MKESWEQLNLEMLRSRHREIEMSGDEKEQRFYFLPCREEERRRRASGAHNSWCKPAAGERQCPISASGFSPVGFFKCDFLDLNLVALFVLVQ